MVDYSKNGKIIMHRINEEVKHKLLLELGEEELTNTNLPRINLIKN